MVSQTSKIASELAGRVRMVVHSQVDVSIVPPLVAPTFADHEESGGLPPAAVPTRGVTREQRREEPVAQVALGR